jgi:hypothetical protein
VPSRILYQQEIKDIFETACSVKTRFTVIEQDRLETNRDRQPQYAFFIITGILCSHSAL